MLTFISKYMTAQCSLKRLVGEREKEKPNGEGRGQRELTFPHNDYAHLFIPSPGAGGSLSLPEMAR